MIQKKFAINYQEIELKNVDIKIDPKYKLDLANYKTEKEKVKKTNPSYIPLITDVLILDQYQFLSFPYIVSKRENMKY